MHGDRLADIPFPKRVRDELLKAGRVRPHHVLPSSGWASRPIGSEQDADDVIALLRLNYDRAVAAAAAAAAAADRRRRRRSRRGSCAPSGPRPAG